MTSKQRILSALQGKPVDRTPFSPNLAYWIDFQPSEIRDSCEVALLKKMGADPMIRGHYPNNDKGKHWEPLYVYDTLQSNCSITHTIDGEEKTTSIVTPKGTLEARYIFSAHVRTWFLKEHPVKRVEDLAIVRALFDDMTLVPNSADYDELCEQYGEDAFIIPMLAPHINMKSGFQSLVEFWLGTEELAYMVLDEPEEIEETVKSMRRVSRIAANICADSKSECFITWEDSSTTNISPDMYMGYIVPELNEWSDILAKKGKMYMQHACGHLNNIIKMMSDSKISGIESLSPPPTGDITMDEVARVLDPKKFVVGGVEAVILESFTLSELEVYARKLLDTMKGRPFVMGNSDSCPPGVSFEKFELLARVARDNA